MINLNDYLRAIEARLKHGYGVIDNEWYDIRTLLAMLRLAIEQRRYTLINSPGLSAEGKEKEYERMDAELAALVEGK